MEALLKHSGAHSGRGCAGNAHLAFHTDAAASLQPSKRLQPFPPAPFRSGGVEAPPSKRAPCPRRHCCCCCCCAVVRQVVGKMQSQLDEGWRSWLSFDLIGKSCLFSGATESSSCDRTAYELRARTTCRDENISHRFASSHPHVPVLDPTDCSPLQLYAWCIMGAFERAACITYSNARCVPCTTPTVFLRPYTAHCTDANEL